MTREVKQVTLVLLAFIAYIRIIYIGIDMCRYEYIHVHICMHERICIYVFVPYL